MRGFPKRYIVFDTETQTRHHRDIFKTQELTLQLGVGKGFGRWSTHPYIKDMCLFTDSMAFHEWIRSWPMTDEKIWIFAHNAGFDLRIVEWFKYLSDGWYSLWDPRRKARGLPPEQPLIVMDNPPLIIRCYRPDGQELLLCDTFQWFTCSLKRIGDTFGMPKGEDPGPDAPIGERLAYCERDVDCLNHALKTTWQWLKNNKVSAFHPTRAGQARYIFRTKYENKRITYHDDETASKFERLAYYGGKTDLYEVGKVTGPVYQLDVNSLYPYVMQERWYPTQLVDRGTEEIEMKLPAWKDWSHYTAEVCLLSDDIGYPIRNRDGTWFCRGRVRTVLAGPELKLAYERGHIKRVLRWNRYAVGKIFHEFISHYWSERVKAKERGDMVADNLIKLLMNSLYGKFAQQTGEWVYHDAAGEPGSYGQGTTIGLDNSRVITQRWIDGKNFLACPQDEARGSFIAISSFVTSYARVLMDSIIDRLPSRGYYYQATDSLYVDSINYDYLLKAGCIEPKTLGKFKHEATYKEVTFKNIHHLDRDDDKVRGSIRAKAIDFGNDQFVVEAWESFEKGIFSGNVSKVFIREIYKTLHGRFVRREILPNGRTRPWKINNWHIPPELMRTTSVRACQHGLE